MIRSCVYFINWLQKVGDLSPPKDWGPKHAKFRSISYNLRLWSRISPEWLMISKNGKLMFPDRFLLRSKNKKAVLSQRWPRNAPYMVPWKCSWLPDYAHGYYSQHFSWAFVPIHPMNVPTKFEVRSLTRSWDNRGYPKNLGSPWIRPCSLFSNIF